MKAAPSDPARLVEALLFASAQPLTGAEIAARLPEGADLAAILRDLSNRYAGRGVELVERDGAFAFRTAPDLAGALDLERAAQRPLSRAAMETLAVIAYHQPVTRAEIEAIRGVSVQRSTLDILVESQWVKPGRRRDTLGRPATWVTTPGFLDHFALTSLDDLPQVAEMKAAGLVGTPGPDLFTAPEDA